MINAYAAFEPGGELKPFQYDPGPLGADDVEIAVEHCGICHSDLSMRNDEWGMSSYPFVPGHEAIGTIAAVGDRVTHLKPGQRVGLGWHAGYCMVCPSCMSGDHNLCATASQTIVGRHGAFADRVRARAASVLPLPEGLDRASAGPLFCAGITVFNPLIQFGVRPTDAVAVIGIGGLGHMALQFYRAWGCHVTAFTSSPAKRDEALRLGAHETIDSRDPAALKGAAGRFALVASTVNVTLDWNAYVATLQPKGRLHFLGVAPDPLDLNVVSLLHAQLSISASPVGSPATIKRMLDFAARHGLNPVTEHFRFDQVNEAMAHLESGNVRYRIVLSH